MERQLIGEYEHLVDELLGKLAAENHAVAVELASVPEDIRGYGHVKARHLDRARAKQKELLARFRGPGEAEVIRMPVKAA
jgi:indolepyruvate ferredoxin oxidoreductase